MDMKKVLTGIASLAFVLGLVLSSYAAREVVSGTVDKVDAMKGQVVLKTAAGPREFVLRTPEKLKDVKAGDKIEITIQEDGSAVIEEKAAPHK
jgi:Cu/Ag efflux protein CusF